MKKNRSFKFYPLIAVLSVAVFATFMFISCSDDDKLENLPEMSGKEKSEFLKKQVLDGKGDILFEKSENVEGVYLFAVSDPEDAHGLAETLSCNYGWNGTSDTVELGDGFGSIRVAQSEKEGVYYTLVFNVTAFPGFTLEIATPEYCESENASTSGISSGSNRYWKCKSCRSVFTGAPQKKCPRCGKSN